VGDTNSNRGNRKASEASASFLKKEAKNFYLLSSRLPVAYTIVLARHAVGNSEPSVIFFLLVFKKEALCWPKTLLARTAYFWALQQNDPWSGTKTSDGVTMDCFAKWLAIKIVAISE
jgi:hypothetical protein